MDATTRSDARTLLALLALILILVTALTFGVGTGNAATPALVPSSALFPHFRESPAEACGPALRSGPCAFRIFANNGYTVLVSTTITTT